MGIRVRWGKRARSGKVFERIGIAELGSHGVVKCTAAEQPCTPQLYIAPAVSDIRGAGCEDTATVAAKADSAVRVKDNATVVLDSRAVAYVGIEVAVSDNHGMASVADTHAEASADTAAVASAGNHGAASADTTVAVSGGSPAAG